jgi:hypothetical protein
MMMSGLRWQHTEFGRRTEDGAFRIVHQPGGGWQLLDADWNPLGVCASIPVAQQFAEGVARARARREAVERADSRKEA